MAIFLILMVIILFVPKNEQKEQYQTPKCDLHKWEKRPSGIEDFGYLICGNCGFLPNGEMNEV